MEQTINGKTVTFRDKLRAKDGWTLMQKFSAMQEASGVDADGDPTFDMSKLDFDDVAVMISGLVDKWEFDGDPHDLEAIGELDLFVELLPMLNAMGEVMSALTPDAAPEAKN